MDGQKAHEKMLEISDHQGNANPNNNDTSSHSCQNGCHQKEHKQPMLAEMCWKGYPHTLLVGMSIGAATEENSMEVSQKLKN